jgi:hypothetical protein
MATVCEKFSKSVATLERMQIIGMRSSQKGNAIIVEMERPEAPTQVSGRTHQEPHT